MILRYLLAWLPMILIGIANGVLRELTYGKYISKLYAHHISTLTGILFFGIYIWRLTRRWELESAKQAFSIGFIWLFLTIAFEFLFGHYVMGNSWSKLFHDYNIFEGRVWSLVLIWITIAPFVFYRLHK